MSIVPISAFVPVAPDSDWEGVRSRLVTHLAEEVPDAWSDHNPVDPGVTLAELAAFGVADLHYRVGTRAAPAWPIESPAWMADAERHWHATLPQGELADLAATLAGPGPAGGSVADDLEPLVRDALTEADAVAMLADAAWAPLVPAAHRVAVVALLRARLVRQVAHEHAAIVAEAVEAEKLAGGTVAARDVRAATRLENSLPLWPSELTALVRRERRRLNRAAVASLMSAIRAGSPTVGQALTDAELTTEEEAFALAGAAIPAGVLPEDLEHADGASKIWPPHGIQALTCEPVTAEDYARRARTHPQVGRAWAVKGLLAGGTGRPAIGWDGLPVPATILTRKGAITLVVERTAGSSAAKAFLRQVLATAIGTEVSQAHPTWRDTLDPLDPRRTICDAVGAVQLGTQAITLKGVLVTGIGVDRQATITAALARVAAFFAAGRPESRIAEALPAVDGPWPFNAQPGMGWNPGEPIRFTEVVEAIVADPTVYGVKELWMMVDGGAPIPSSAGSVSLAPDCIPILATNQCLMVEFSLTGQCNA